MKPSVLLVSGDLAIITAIVEQLLVENLVEKLYILSKKHVDLLLLADKEKKLIKDERVEYIQCNLRIIEAVKSKISGKKLDYIFDLTSRDEDFSFYPSEYHKLSVELGKKCASENVKLLRLSTGQVYGSHSNPSGESSKTSPKTPYGKQNLAIDEALLSTRKLNVAIIRAAIIYGPYCTNEITKFLLIAQMHKHMNKKLTLIGNPKTPMNTVNCIDVARGALHVLGLKRDAGEKTQPFSGKEIYNLSDSASTKRDTIKDLLGCLFEIEVDFVDKITNSIAMKNTENLVEYVNSEFIGPWGDICKADGLSSLLTPIIDNSFISMECHIDSTKIRETLGFNLIHEQPTKENLGAVIDKFRDLGAFPK